MVNLTTNKGGFLGDVETLESSMITYNAIGLE